MTAEKQKTGIFIVQKILLSLFIFYFLTACVVKEDLQEFEKIYSGLNYWRLTQKETGWHLDFNLGYLIGLKDEQGISAIDWKYELINVRRNVLLSKQEEMRAQNLDKQQIFVNGTRSRNELIPYQLVEGDRYVLWFTFFYRENVIHEALYEVVAGQEGENRDWVNEIIENVDVSNIRVLSGFDMSDVTQVNDLDAFISNTLP
jgi:hypothetical protein